MINKYRNAYLDARIGSSPMKMSFVYEIVRMPLPHITIIRDAYMRSYITTCTFCSMMYDSAYRIIKLLFHYGL